MPPEENTSSPAASTPTTPSAPSTPAPASPAVSVEPSSSAPASTPAAPAAGPSVDAPVSDGVDWTGISAPDHEEVVTTTDAPPAPAAATPASPVPATPAATAAPAVPVVPAVPATPAVTPATPATPQPAAAAPEVPGAPAQTPEQRQAEEEKLTSQLVEYYKFDEATAAQLQSEPELVLPKLAAQMHVAMMKGMVNMMTQFVPQIVATHTQRATREESSKNMFFAAYPDLKGYERQILEVGAMFRRMNPTASPEEAVQRIGETVRAALGLTKAAVTTTPPAPPVRAPGSTFRPAGGGLPAGPNQITPDNPFTKLAEELSLDD